MPQNCVMNCLHCINNSKLFRTNRKLKTVNRKRVVYCARFMAKKGTSKPILFFQKIWQLLLMFILLGFQVTIFFVILYRVMPVPVTPLHLVRVYEQIRDGKNIKLSKEWKSIDYVSDKFCLAVITAEDVKFIQHYGFDFEQIQNSIERGLKRGKKLRGASTISQQTAKNLFFTPKRSWISKA